MGGVEIGRCDFCGEVKPLERFYVNAKNRKDKNKNGFAVVRFCRDCGCAGSEKIDSGEGGAEMKDRRCTAREMRKFIGLEKFRCTFVTRTVGHPDGIIIDCTRDVVAVLRQAADSEEKSAKLKARIKIAEDALEAISGRVEALRVALAGASGESEVAK